MKKSFILHLDSLVILNKMTNEQAGIFLKTIYHFQNTGEILPLDFGMEMAITPFLNQFKRDNNKYQVFIDKQTENGKKGGRPTKTKENPTLKEESQVNPKNPSLLKETQKTLNDNDSVNDNVSININIQKNNIDERKLKFASTLKPFLDTYGKDMLNDFYSYWTEPNKSNTKFRQEQEKNWDLNRRLKTWLNNNKKFGNIETNPYAPKKGNFTI
jgi:hypothetical protein